MSRYTKKNIGDPLWEKPNNFKIRQAGAVYDVEIVPNKGAKGDISAQPLNDKNVGDIEDALVVIDEDLAFVESDYVVHAEHDLKQNITDMGLNTVAKDIVPAINEVKADSEFHDLLQDDAIAIVNNKINALPMNGSLKNIRNSLVGLPTTFTNIDMFNTKQVATNYQPLSLDYKGSSEPHIIVMKTIGDYTFDFSVEATHTNGTDTTIIIEAWVDGILYDTATRTLVGGSNQINGIVGFFTYSKGTDTTPTEIYFRFRASQGNTSANKTMINTNLLGNSAENEFTDSDHVTGSPDLDNPAYEGQSLTFILNDMAENTVDARTYRLSPIDIGVPDDTLPLDVDDALLALLNGLNAHLVDKGGSVAYDLNSSAVLRDLIVDKINSLPGWKTITDENLVFDFELTNFTYETGAIIQDYGHIYLTNIVNNTRYDIPINTGVVKWDLMTNEKGDRFDYELPLDNTDYSPTDFGANLQLMVNELSRLKHRDVIYKCIVYGEAHTTHGNLQKSFKAYMDTRSADWDMSWYTPTHQLGIEIYRTQSVDLPASTEFEVKVIVLDDTKTYYFRCESDAEGIIKTFIVNEKGQKQDTFSDTKQIWSLDELGLDGTWSSTSVPTNIKKAYDKIVSYIGNNTPFAIVQALYLDSGADHYEFSYAVNDSIGEEYGQQLASSVFEFSITFGTTNGVTNINTNNTNFIRVKSYVEEYTRLFRYDNWTGGGNYFWLDEKGAPHADIIFDVRSYGTEVQATNLNAPYRNMISGATVTIADYQEPESKYGAGDTVTRYIPRVVTRIPLSASNITGEWDTLFTPYHGVITGINSADPVPTSMATIAQAYFYFNYAVTGDTYPNGINLFGLLNAQNDDQVISNIVIHYGNKNWEVEMDKIVTSAKGSVAPANLLKSRHMVEKELQEVATPKAIASETTRKKTNVKN